MRRVRLALTIVSIVLLSACACGRAAKGGVADGGALGEGNVPIAQPGNELPDVHFDFDSSALSEGTRASLGESSRYLLDNPEKKVIVEGHCDERGTAEYNYALGQRRAQSVYDYLRSLGVKGEQMDTVSYGEDVPLNPASNEEAWAMNRRAHFGDAK